MSTKYVCNICGRPVILWSATTWKHAANGHTPGKCPKAVPIERSTYDASLKAAIENAIGPRPTPTKKGSR